MRTAAAPQPPEAPEVTRREKNKATLTFKPPDDNGYSEITSYILEMKADSGTEWETVGKDIAKLEFTATGLQPRVEYVFRVTAVNEIGPGQPSSPSIPSKFGKFIQSTNATQHAFIR